MTCIAAMVDGSGRGHIACDSLGSNHHTKSVYRTPKIFRREEFLIGFTGSYRMGQILQYNLDLPPRKVNQSDEDYLHADFIGAVRGAFSDNGFGDSGEFLLVYHGRIYTHQSDHSLLESIDPFETSGSGEDYARAALHTTTALSPDALPVDHLRHAIETAARYVCSVGGEIHYLEENEK